MNGKAFATDCGSSYTTTYASSVFRKREMFDRTVAAAAVLQVAERTAAEKKNKNGRSEDARSMRRARVVIANHDEEKTGRVQEDEQCAINGAGSC